VRWLASQSVSTSQWDGDGGIEGLSGARRFGGADSISLL
jgi:hypothetical protein